MKSAAIPTLSQQPLPRLPPLPILCQAESAPEQILYLRFRSEILLEVVYPSPPAGITAFSALLEAFEPSVGMISRDFRPIPNFWPSSAPLSTGFQPNCRKNGVTCWIPVAKSADKVISAAIGLPSQQPLPCLLPLPILCCA